MKAGLFYGAAGSAAVAARNLGIETIFNYETRGEPYLKTFMLNFGITEKTKGKAAIDNLEDLYSFIDDYGLPEIIIGQPDCKIYSNLRTRKKGIVSFKTTQLYSFLMFINEFLPRVFIVENLTKGIQAALDYLQNESFKDSDFYRALLSGIYLPDTTPLLDKYFTYTIEINALHFLPQSRKRTFLIGFKKTDFTGEFNYRPPKGFYDGGVIDLLKDLEDPKSSRFIKNHRPPNHSPERIKRFQKLKYGESYYGTQNNRRLDPDKHAGAITSHCTQAVHYKLPRTLTCRENARLMGWPDDYEFWGNNTSCLDQVGKAIVIPVMEYLLKQVVNYVQRNSK